MGDEFSGRDGVFAQFLRNCVCTLFFYIHALFFETDFMKGKEILSLKDILLILEPLIPVSLLLVNEWELPYFVHACFLFLFTVIFTLTF